MSEDLEPCPFCKGSAQYSEDFNSIHCSFCGAEFGEYEDIETLDKYWNDRPEETRLNTIIAAQRGVITALDSLHELCPHRRPEQEGVMFTQETKARREELKAARAKLREAEGATPCP